MARLLKRDRPTFSFAATRDGEPFAGAVLSLFGGQRACPTLHQPDRARAAASKRGRTPSSSTPRTPQHAAIDVEPARTSFTVFEEEASRAKNSKGRRGEVDDCDGEAEASRPGSACCARRAPASSPATTRFAWGFATRPLPAPITVDYRLTAPGSLKLGSEAARRDDGRPHLAGGSAKRRWPRCLRPELHGDDGDAGSPAYCRYFFDSHLTSSGRPTAAAWSHQNRPHPATPAPGPGPRGGEVPGSI